MTPAAKVLDAGTHLLPYNHWRLQILHLDKNRLQQKIIKTAVESFVLTEEFLHSSRNSFQEAWIDSSNQLTLHQYLHADLTQYQ